MAALAAPDHRISATVNPAGTAHCSVTELEADIRALDQGLNKNPRRFIWTKTAQAILRTLAAYCQRINDSGHKRVCCEGGCPP
jgi:hypothetical protein